MSYTPPHDPHRHVAPETKQSLGYTLVAAALLSLATVALVLAVLYPGAAVGVAALTVAGGYTVHLFRRGSRTRRRLGRTVCVPTTSVCIEL